jgi:hypothetical protein
VQLNAMGLADGIHSAEIVLTSNDPYTPQVTVPVTLNVSLVAATYVDFEPDVLNLAAQSNTVKVVVELPPSLDPRGVDPCSVLLNDVVPVVGCPGTPSGGAVEFTDDHPAGGNGIEEISFRFDRAAASAVIGEGENVTVSIQGEVTDVQWWRGSTTVRTMHPRVTSPSTGDWYLAGWSVVMQWQPPATGVEGYVVLLSRDGGFSWEQIASGVTGTSFTWIADAIVTTTARIRVVALDDQGNVVGYDESDGDFTLAGSTLRPPRSVDPETIWVDDGPAGMRIEWRSPEADLSYGPASGFRILTSDRPDGPFTETALVSVTEFTDPSIPPIGTAFFYRIIATNAAGDAQ